MSPQERREAGRTAVLEFLAERPHLLFDLALLHQRLNKTGKLDFTAELDEVRDAVAFLEGSKYVERDLHAHGATPFFRITSAGVLAHERGTLQPRPL